VKTTDFSDILLFIVKFSIYWNDIYMFKKILLSKRANKTILI